MKQLVFWWTIKSWGQSDSTRLRLRSDLQRVSVNNFDFYFFNFIWMWSLVWWRDTLFEAFVSYNCEYCRFDLTDSVARTQNLTNVAAMVHCFVVERDATRQITLTTEEKGQVRCLHWGFYWKIWNCGPIKLSPNFMVLTSLNLSGKKNFF